MPINEGLWQCPLMRVCGNAHAGCTLLLCCVCAGSPERRQLNFSLLHTANRPTQGTPTTALSRTPGEILVHEHCRVKRSKFKVHTGLFVITYYVR